MFGLGAQTLFLLYSVITFKTASFGSGNPSDNYLLVLNEIWTEIKYFALSQLWMSSYTRRESRDLRFNPLRMLTPKIFPNQIVWGTSKKVDTIRSVKYILVGAGDKVNCIKEKQKSEAKTCHLQKFFVNWCITCVQAPLPLKKTLFLRGWSVCTRLIVHISKETQWSINERIAGGHRLFRKANCRKHKRRYLPPPLHASLYAFSLVLVLGQD